MMQRNNFQPQQRQASRVQWNVVIEVELEPNEKHGDERIAKVYKETNKEYEEWRALVQHWKDEK